MLCFEVTIAFNFGIILLGGPPTRGPPTKGPWTPGPTQPPPPKGKDYRLKI